jgi:acetate CoA/acetoacetate CoA-transferase alpha subunit
LGIPYKLIDAIVERNPPPRDLCVITNDPGFPDDGVGRLIHARLVRKLTAAFIGTNEEVFAQRERGELEVEVIPEGTLAERFRAGGAGLGGYLTEVGLGTPVEEGKDKVYVNGRPYLIERPIRAHVGLVKAHKADLKGNLIYQETARNFNPLVATCSDLVIAEVDEIVKVGEIDPEAVVTPFIYVDVLVKIRVREWGRFRIWR